MDATGPASGEGHQGAREFRMHSVLTRSGRILWEHSLYFSLIWAINCTLPILLLGGRNPVNRGISPSHIVIVMLVTLLVGLLVQSIETLMIMQHLIGERARISDAIQRVLSHSVQLVVTFLFVIVTVVVGMFLLVFPGIMAMVTLSVALPACIVESIGPFASLSRSAKLTKFHRWPIFAALAGIATLAMVLDNMAVGAVLRHPEARSAFISVQILLSTALASYLAIVTPVMYHDLRAAKEWADTNRLEPRNNLSVQERRELYERLRGGIPH